MKIMKNGFRSVPFMKKSNSIILKSLMGLVIASVLSVSLASADGAEGNGACRNKGVCTTGVEIQGNRFVLLLNGTVIKSYETDYMTPSAESDARKLESEGVCYYLK